MGLRLDSVNASVSAGQASPETVRDQPDGGADPEGHHSVLRLRYREAEGPLPQHSVLQGNLLLLTIRKHADHLTS